MGNNRSFASVGDVDRNGFNDLIAGGAYNNIKLLTAGTGQRLFKNNGDSTFTRVPNPFTSNAMESV